MRDLKEWQKDVIYYGFLSLPLWGTAIIMTILVLCGVFAGGGHR